MTKRSLCSLRKGAQGTTLQQRTMEDRFVRLPSLFLRAAVQVVVGVEYRIQRYRPRVEGLFARIERWTSLRTGETHWRSITPDNITTLYGKDNNSRIFDP